MFHSWDAAGNTLCIGGSVFDHFPTDKECDSWVMCQAMYFCSERCRDNHFGCDASSFSETEPLEN